MQTLPTKLTFRWHSPPHMLPPSMAEISTAQKLLIKTIFRGLMVDAINTFGYVPLPYSRRLWQWARKDAHLIEQRKK